MLLWSAAAPYAGPLEDCEQAQAIDRRIQGCTDRIRQFPRDATAFFNRASAYQGKGDLNSAIADYTRVIEIDPAYSPAYYHRGVANRSRGQYDTAIADFSKAIEINPRHGQALDARARTYLSTDQYELALRDAERAVSLDPFDTDFLNTRAHVYEALGRGKEAIADYRRLRSSNPSMQSAIQGLERLGVSLSQSATDNARQAKHSPKAPLDAAQPRHSREETECERARQADPGGYYAGYPCWARAALGPGIRGSRGR